MYDYSTSFPISPPHKSWEESFNYADDAVSLMQARQTRDLQTRQYGVSDLINPQSDF